MILTLKEKIEIIIFLTFYESIVSLDAVTWYGFHQLNLYACMGRFPVPLSLHKGE